MSVPTITTPLKPLRAQEDYDRAAVLIRSELGGVALDPHQKGDGTGTAVRDHKAALIREVARSIHVHSVTEAFRIIDAAYPYFIGNRCTDEAVTAACGPLRRARRLPPVHPADAARRGPQHPHRRPRRHRRCAVTSAENPAAAGQHGTLASDPTSRYFPAHAEVSAMTDPTIAPFLHDEISHGNRDLMHARRRLHAASMIAISRLITAHFPAARALVVDCTFRTLEPVGPTVAEILDSSDAALFSDDTRSYSTDGNEPGLDLLLEHLHQLLAGATDIVDLDTLGWSRHSGEHWRHPLAAEPLLSGTWTFLSIVAEPGSHHRCYYARTGCPRCHGNGYPSAAKPPPCCDCVISFP